MPLKGTRCFAPSGLSRSALHTQGSGARRRVRLHPGLCCAASSRLAWWSREAALPARGWPGRAVRLFCLVEAGFAEPRSGEADQPRVEAAQRPEPWVRSDLD